MCRVFYKGNGSMNKVSILSYGINKLSEGVRSGIHAEHDSIRKLLPLKRKKRLENINILVIRVSGKNKLQSSKPCVNCIIMMKTLPIKLGYKIQNVYYSNENSDIIKSSLKNLEMDEPHYSKYYKHLIKDKSQYSTR